MKKIIFILIIGAVVIPMFIKGPDGEPIVRLSDLLPAKPDLGGVTTKGNANGSYYRYQDSQGNWQYTDQPPVGVDFEMVEVDTDANIIQSVDPAAATRSSSAPAAGVTGYVDNLQNVMQDAEDVQQLMDGRDVQLQDVLNSGQ